MRKLAAAAVIMLGLLALLGAGRGGTYQGGSYGGASASYQAGGGAAGLDTVRMVLTIDDALDHFDASYDAAVAAADTVIELGTDVPFAWDIIYRLYPNDNYSQNLNLALSSRSTNFALTDSIANRYLGLFRVDFARIIPERSTVISADVHGINSNAGYVAREDSFMAVLMTQPGDTAWYRQSTLGIPGQPSYQINYMAHASWRNQIAGVADGAPSGTGYNYPATSSSPWVPALNMRPYIWDWGSVWDWSKYPYPEASPTAQAADEETMFSIRNCVQAAVSGAINNGIMWSVLDKVDLGIARFWGWEPSSADYRTKRPWIEITYTTRRYREPLGADFAVLLFTDDGFPANMQYDSLFQLIDPDYNFTIGFESFAPNSVGKLTDTQIIALHDRGNEIATHGYHPPSYAGQPAPFGGTIVSGREGLNFYIQGSALVNYTRGMSQSGLALPGTTGYDSTCFQMDPAWLDSLAVAEGRPDLANSPRWGKGFHVPNAGISLNAIRAMRDVGLSWTRTLPASTKTNATGGHYERTRRASTPAGDPGYALADSLFIGVPYAQQTLRPYNLRCFPTTFDLNVIFGATTANYSEAQIKHYMRRALAGVRGDGTKVLAFTTHRQKSASQDGLDLDEARWMAEVIKEWGGRMMTANEWITTMRSTAVAVATPDDWGQETPYNWEYQDAQLYRMSGSHYRQRQSVDLIADTTAPSPPISMAAANTGYGAIMTWTAPTVAEPLTYSVYRFFQNAADTVLVASGLTAPYYLHTDAVLGVPASYYVTALDAFGNESAISSVASVLPKAVLSVGSPGYYTFWFNNPADATMSTATRDSLTAFDLVVMGEDPLRGNADEPAYAGLTAAARTTNADWMAAAYIVAVTPKTEWATWPTYTPQRKIWDYCDDNDLFARGTDSEIVEGDVFPTRYANVMVPSLADTIAKFYVAALDASGIDGDYTGFMVDLADSSLNTWSCDSGNCGDLMDYDQDTMAFSADADERAAYKAFQLRFLRALRRECGERGMDSRLIIANTNWLRSEAEDADRAAFAGLIDGVYLEGANEYWPGDPALSDTTRWNVAAGIAARLPNSQVSPPLVLWASRADSSALYMTEAMALTGGAWAGAQPNGVGQHHGKDAIATIPRRLPSLGLFAGVTFQDGGAGPDTMTSTWSNLTARIVLGPNEGAAETDTSAVWPYLITDAAGDIVSRSAFWELPDEVGPPPAAPQFVVAGGDNQVTVTWSASLYPSDFDHVNIYRSPHADVDSLDLFVVGPTANVVNVTDRTWTDATAANDSQYCYAVTVVDVNGQESALSDFDCATPDDSTAPPRVSDLKIAGADGFIDLDWSAVSASDLIGYEVSRADETGDGPGSFAVTDTVTASAHQDSTALGGNFYYFRVRSLDDDDNRSAYSDTVFGSWINDPDPPATPAPSNVMAWADQPTGRTSVVIYAPADTTGLTGYQVFRGASADTSACALYKTNIAVGQFAGAVFEDPWANTDPDSTKYYTAKAMYGAARSEKFHTPRGALTTGGYQGLTPVTFCAGATNAIYVAWSQIAGSDSTLIYRGTTPETQTYLTTVAHAANPYLDTGTAASTDYYYRVRFKDNPSTYTGYSAVFGPVQRVSVPSGDPTVGSVTGAVAHGGEIVIAGTGFGDKAQSAPLKWDDFEAGTPGNLITGWNTYNSYGGDLPTYSTAQQRTAGSISSRQGPTGNSSMYLTGLDIGGNDYLYVSGWFKGTTTGLSHSTKFININAGEWQHPEVRTGGGPGDGGGWAWWSDTVACDTGGVSPMAYKYVDNPYNQAQWHRWEWQYQHGNPGYFDAYVDGVKQYTFSGNYSFNGCPLNNVYFTSYWGTNPPYTGTTYNAYWDELYVDTTPARVEIGNASTWAACTHREIQIPTSWSATSIAVIVNKGTFAAGGAYLYVVAADGTVSAGFPITVAP